MKNNILNILFPSLLVLNSCILFPTTDVLVTSTPSASSVFSSNSPGPFITTTPTVNPTPTGIINLTPVPSPIATTVVKTGGIIKLIGTTVDWGDLNASEKSRFIVQDFEHRRLVYREKPADTSEGEFEFTWDAPPAEIGVDEFATINITTKLNAVPGNSIGSTIKVSSTGAGFFEASPAETVTAYVGWFTSSNVVNPGGTSQIKLKPVGIKSLFWNESSKISIYVNISYGPTIFYNYQIVRT